jgi:hypothetical protein
LLLNQVLEPVMLVEDAHVIATVTAIVAVVLQNAVVNAVAKVCNPLTMFLEIIWT